MKRVFTALTLMLMVSALLVACGDSTATTIPANTTGATGTIPAGTATTNAINTTVATSAGTVTTKGTATTAMTTGAMTPTTTSAGTPGVSATAGTTSSMGLTQTDTGLPAYTGATTIKVGSTFEQTIATPFIGQILGSGTNVKYSVFKTTDNSDKILPFYDSAMTKLGLTKVADTGNLGASMMPSMMNLTNLVKVATYQKPNSTIPAGAGLVVLGPMDITTLTALSAVDSSISSSVKAGDSLVILVSNLSNGNS